MSNGSARRTSSLEVDGDSRFIAEISKDSTDTDLVLIDKSGVMFDSKFSDSFQEFYF